MKRRLPALTAVRRGRLRGLAMTFLLLFVCGITNIPKINAQERIRLIKTQGNAAVYFVDKENTRHVFPNREVYESWYGNDFSNVVTVSSEYLASVKLGPNVTWKPGKALLNVPSTREVYAVEPGGTLSAIKNEEVAKMIFGNDWYREVRALPEIFFQNYVIGKPIANQVDVPDGWIIKEEIADSRGLDADERGIDYYIKWRGVLQMFQSADAMKKNGYAQADALTTDSSYFSRRSSSIKDSVERFVDPAFTPNVSSLSCDMSDLKLGIIVVSDRSLAQDEIGVLYDSIFQLPKYYSDSTDGLGSARAENNVVLMNFQKMFDDKEHSTLSFEEVAQTYYDGHEDDIDFLAVFHTVYNHRQQENEIARYIPISNSINGVGRHLFNRANQFGSMGRLKGVLDMGNITQYAGDVGKGPASPDARFADESRRASLGGPNLTLGTLVHEMMHSVSGSLMVLDDSNTTSDILMGKDDPFHWSRFLLETSFLGGDGWVSEGRGGSRSAPTEDGWKIYQSAVSTDSEFRRTFSNLDLYAFGFIPARSVGPIQYLEVTDRSNPTHRVEGAVKTVSMDQLLAVNGKRECAISK